MMNVRCSCPTIRSGRSPGAPSASSIPPPAPPSRGPRPTPDGSADRGPGSRHDDSGGAASPPAGAASSAYSSPEDDRRSRIGADARRSASDSRSVRRSSEAASSAPRRSTRALAGCTFTSTAPAGARSRAATIGNRPGGSQSRYASCIDQASRRSCTGRPSMNARSPSRPRR